MLDALQRAARFLENEGSPLDRARLGVLLGAGVEPARRVLEALQREDGSFPALRAGPAGPAPRATASALEVLTELRVRRAGSVERAVAYLTANQAADGSWGSGAPETRLGSCGRIGAALGRTVYARPEVLAAAGDFLGRQFAPERVEGGAWETLAGVAAFFANVDHERADDVLQWCGRALEKGFRSRTFSSARAARILTLCDAGGLPGAQLDPSELVLGVLAEQQDDGGWLAAEGTSGGRPAATVEAAYALARLDASATGG